MGRNSDFFWCNQGGVDHGRGTAVGEHIKVGGNEIAGLVAQLQTVHRAMERELENLQRSLDRLSGQWSGEAQQAYAHAQQRWNGSMRELNNEIDRLRRRTHDANEAFSQAERANKRVWS